MTPKERAAMQQALIYLDAIINGEGVKPYQLEGTAFTLREALEHSGEANEMVGCAYCNNPLFAGTKCNNCGRVVSQPVSQEYQDHLVNQSFDWSAMAAKHQFMEGYRIGLAEMREKCAKVAERFEPDEKCNHVEYASAAIRAIKFEGDTGFRPVYEMVAEHKQAEQEPVGEVVMESMGVGDAQIVRFRMNGRIPPVGTKLYTRPVRTKDLTDDEIEKAYIDGHEGTLISGCRAVIAADREKNK